MELKQKRDQAKPKKVEVFVQVNSARRLRFQARVDRARQIEQQDAQELAAVIAVENANLRAMLARMLVEKVASAVLGPSLHPHHHPILSPKLPELGSNSEDDSTPARTPTAYSHVNDGVWLEFPASTATRGSSGTSSNRSSRDGSSGGGSSAASLSSSLESSMSSSL